MLKNNKGVAIELAMFMLLIIFALCAGIVSITYRNYELSHSSFDDYSKRLTIEQIGEDYINHVKSDSGEPFTIEGYDCEESKNDSIYHLLLKDGDLTVLSIVYNKNENKILSFILG